MKALTLIRPWPFAIFDLPHDRAKDVENRTWAPPAKLVGEVIAIHAGLKLDKAAVYTIGRIAGSPIPGDGGPTGIVGVARIAKVVRERTSPWFFGPYGWMLADVRRLAVPVPCRGAQGLWTVPADIEATVRAQLAMPPAAP